ncbi:MAG TPA: hypothetical protein VMI09_03560, partial [Candidatus Binataceae bacterium]|nr:hypothetical protein [Candidatus Binataceae bacterium]
MATIQLRCRAREDHNRRGAWLISYQKQLLARTEAQRAKHQAQREEKARAEAEAARVEAEAARVRLTPLGDRLARLLATIPIEVQREGLSLST